MRDNAVTPGSPLRLLACSGSLDGGGSERQLSQLVSRLDRQRVVAEVYLLAKRGPYLEQLPANIPVHAFDVDCPAPSSLPPGRISFLERQHLRRIVQSRGIDVVYDRTFHMSLLTGWALPASQPRISVIVSPPSRDLPASERRYLSIKRWLLARAYRSATVTICVSDEVAEDASRYYGLSRSRLTVMHNPVDTHRVRGLATGIDSQNVLGDRLENCLRIAVVGRFTGEKGHQLAIDALKSYRVMAAAQAKSLHLHFVGDGPLKSSIESIVAQSSLEKWVHFHGYQCNPYPYMIACDVVMVPSSYEGFPNVALEAMALGIPLLMTDYGPTARAIAGTEGQRAFLVPLGDSHSAARALVNRIEQANAWQARAIQARQWIEREHALEPWLEKMTRMFEELASGRVARRRS